MKDLIQAKFDQNQNLREKLLDVPYRKFYEMTGDRLWATGRRINKADKKIDTDELKSGKNLVGHAIARVKNGYILEEIRAGRREPEEVNTCERESLLGSTNNTEKTESDEGGSTSTVTSNM